MIKNANQLEENEYAKLEILFLKYFRDYCVYRRGLPRGLEHLLMRVNAKAYAKKSVERIKSGEWVAFVLLSLNNEFEGFIAGKTTKSGEAWLSHIFVNHHCVSRAIFSQKLFKEFALEMKKRGMTTIATESSYEDPRLIDTLEGLDFEEIKTEKYYVEYGKKL